MKFITTALLVVFLPYLIQHPSIENWVVYGIGVTLNAGLYILGRFKPKAIKTSPVKYQTSVKEKSSTFDWKRFCEEVGRRSLEKT
jgi:hypothetical protein